jgi:hypothetical protein
MYIAKKDTKIIGINEVEWECRKEAKGLDTPSYMTWLDSVTSGDPPVADYSGETGYTIVECEDENIQERLNQLGDYQADDVYNIKWSDSKTKVTVDEIEIETHFTGDDSAKDARLLAAEWVTIRTERNRLLTETDWWGASDQTMSDDQTTYRVKLRTLPVDQSSKTTYASITWPTKPS